MIVDVNTMKLIENRSGYDQFELMNIVGNKVKDFIISKYSSNKKILILCGSGNNGGDGLIIAKLLNELNYDIKICLIHKKVETKPTKLIYEKINKNLFIDLKHLKQSIKKADLIIDSIYGFGYHRYLSRSDKDIFSLINESNKEIISIDINSGAEANGDYFDSDSIKSNYTLALECFKPFHALKKSHNLFNEVILINLNLKHDIKSNYCEMNKDVFLKNYPVIKENHYKGKGGKALLIGGGWGMLGALGLNIIGALSTGMTYLSVSTDESCYPSLASRFLTCVYHPFNENNWEEIIKPLIENNDSIGFGSGSLRLPAKKKVFDLLLQYSTNPVVLDAEAFNILRRNYYVLNMTKSRVILTPHINEFSRMINVPIEIIEENRFEIAQEFAKMHNVILVLKGVNTIVVSSNYIYINQTGNQILARAGSGDLLTGMITTLTALVKDTFLATSMAVWLHGYIADIAKQKYATTNFKLENYQELLEEFFLENNL